MALVCDPVLPDTGVQGLVANPSSRPEPTECRTWFKVRRQEGFRFRVPEIADDELRRKLLHRTSTNALSRLTCLPITTDAMFNAAELRERPAAPNEALDGDVMPADRIGAVQ